MGFDGLGEFSLSRGTFLNFGELGVWYWFLPVQAEIWLLDISVFGIWIDLMRMVCLRLV